MKPFTPKLDEAVISISDDVMLRMLLPHDGPVLTTMLASGAAPFWHGVTADYLLDMLQEPSVSPYLILREDRAIGYVQLYHANVEPFWQSMAMPAETMGLDILIADKSNQRQGLGTHVLRVLIRRAFGMEGVRQVIIDPHPDNEGALRAYEKIGFKFGAPQDGYEGAPMRLGILTRHDFAKTMLRMLTAARPN